MEKNTSEVIYIQDKKDIDLKLIIEDETGMRFNKYNKMCCPFHKEQTASFSIRKDRFMCFGCGSSGDAIDFIREYKGFNYMEAIKYLGLTSDNSRGLNEEYYDKVKSYCKWINENHDRVKNGGFKLEKIYQFKDENNKVVYYKAKFKNNTGKKEMFYLSIDDTGKVVLKRLGKEIPYNYNELVKGLNSNKKIFIVEGEKDVDTLKAMGYVGASFKGVSEFNYSVFLNKKIYIISDTGKAGEDYTKHLWEQLKDYVKEFNVVTLRGLRELGDNKDITDWINKGYTQKDFKECLKDVWDYKKSTIWANVKIKETKEGITVTPIKSLKNFKLILDRAETEIYFNEITKELDVKTKIFSNNNLNTLATEIYSHCQVIGFPITKREVMDYIDTVGYENSINPFKSYLDSLKDKWDNKSRLQEFYSIFSTVENYQTELKELILYKWLLQFVASAYNEEFKAQGLVILKGKQGLGKTRVFDKLLPKEKWAFLDEQKFEGGRDNIQTITSNQLVELSEFARSNKQIDALKGFITSKYDKLVLKYDKYPISYKRKTVYFATINDDEFLIDDENRRFWIVDLMGINFNISENFDYEQLWAELYYIYHNVDNNYWLSQEEQEQTEKINQNYKFKGELETSIAKHFDFHSNKRIWLNNTEILNILDKEISSTKLSRTLKSMKIEKKEMNNKIFPRDKYSLMPIPKMWLYDIPPKYKCRLNNISIVDNSEDENTKKIKELEKKIQEQQEYIKYLEKKLESQQIKFG